MLCQHTCEDQGRFGRIDCSSLSAEFHTECQFMRWHLAHAWAATNSQDIHNSINPPQPSAESAIHTSLGRRPRITTAPKALPLCRRPSCRRSRNDKIAFVRTGTTALRIALSLNPKGSARQTRHRTSAGKPETRPGSPVWHDAPSAHR